MPKYLVDGDSFEFSEGMEKDSVVAAAQLLTICPIAAPDNPNSYSYDDEGEYIDIVAELPHSITAENFNAINVEAIVHGLTSSFLNSAPYILGNLAFVDTEDNRKQAFASIKRIGGVGTEQDDFLYTTHLNYNVSTEDGSAMIYGTEYCLAEQSADDRGKPIAVNGYSAADSDIMPPIIKGVSFRLFLGSESGDITTNLGIFVKVTGAI